MLHEQGYGWLGGEVESETGGVKGARILIVEARYYDDIADLLLAGAMKVLEDADVVVERITVPGSLEIATAIAIAAEVAKQKGRPYDGVVALGCVIRGDTIHFEIVSQLSAQGCSNFRWRAGCRSATASSPSTRSRRPWRALASRIRTKAATPRARRWRWCGSSAG